MENLEKKLAELEALLFIHGEPLSLDKVGTILGINSEETETLVAEFDKLLEGSERGLALINFSGKIQLVTKAAFRGILEKFVQSELREELTPASVETLAIIAYFGPISRNRIEYQRGVNSAFILRSLLLRGLVERFPDPAHPNTYLYKPSFELLKHLGINKIEELPDYEKFQSLFEKFEAQGDFSGAAAAPKNEEIIADLKTVE
jgi:segregation and condensation protein B